MSSDDLIARGSSATYDLADTSAIDKGAPLLDLEESERELIISCDVPESLGNEIDVYVSADNLVICRKNSEDFSAPDCRNLRAITEDGASFQKTLRLPVGFNTDRSEAILKNGTLTVSIPKIENGDARMRKLEVKAADHFTSGP